MVTVDGTGSTWTNTFSLFVGDSGTGALTIQNGGKVTNTGGTIGSNAGSNGMATVDGAGSTWTNNNNLFVGGDIIGPGGTGLLRIQNGGAVNAATTTVWNTGTLEIGAAPVLNTPLLTFNGGTLRTIANTTFSNNAVLGTNHGNGVIVDSNGFSSTLSGVFSGAGGLRKINPGRIVLTNNNIYTGDTNIDGGELRVDGSIASANTLINPGGLLTGTGFTSGNVSNHGMLSPGDSPGTFTIGGDYTQFVDGTLQIEVAGRNAGEFDLLAVGGAANLSGRLQIVRLNNFVFQRGDRFAILTAGGGVNGVFSPVENPFEMSGTILMIQVIYEPNAVVLEAIQGSFVALPGLTPNQQAVANNLDLVVNDPRENALINFLDAQPLGQLPNDLDLIAPEELASAYEIAVSHATIQSLNLQRRLSDIRAGSNGFCANGLAITTSGKDYNGGKTLIDKNPAPVMQPAADNRWGVFITGSGEFVDVGNGDFNAPGFDITTGGFTLGVDYRVTPNFAVGLNGGYARSDADLVNNGRLTVDGGKLGLYATYFSGGFYLDGAVSGGRNNYDLRRSALLGSAHGKTDGNEFNGLIGAGYDWKMNCWSFGPTATFQYTDVELDEFSEEGSLAPLRFPEQSQDSKRSALGFKIAHDSKLSGGVIVRCEARGAWQHEFSDNAYPIDSQFASGAGSVFTVHGPRTGEDSALVGAGVAVQWNARASTYLSYDGQFRDNYDSHNVSGGVRISF